MQRKLQHPVYKLDNLPEIVYDYFMYSNEFSGKPIKSYTGTIIRRYSNNSHGITWHYCFFYGIDKNGISWVIHNDQYGVECISFIDYLEDRQSYDVDPCTNNFDKQNIILRALEQKNKIFHLRENNCEHFVNYCIYGIKLSMQSQVTKWAENFILWGLELRIGLSNNDKLKKRFQKFKHNISRPPVIKVTKRNR